MRKQFFRAALVACLALFFAGAAFVPTPAVAADNSKPTISRAASKSLTAANKAIQAKDWAAALAALKEAQAIPDLNDYDKYIINYYMGAAYMNTGDKAAAEPLFVAAAQSTAAPDDERMDALLKAMAIDTETNNYARITELSRFILPNVPINHIMAAILAVAYYNTGDYANAALYVDKSITAAAAAGRAPDHTVYQIKFNCQIKKKDIAAAIATLETMANLYGDSSDWGNLITLSLGSLPITSKSSSGIAALYLYRLGLKTGANFVAADYQAMYDAAQGIHSFGDAQTALRTGVNKGVLSGGKFATTLNKLDADIAQDKLALAKADEVAANNPSANLDVSLAEAYYGYGRYADAARVAQRAIAKGGPKANEAHLLLGVAQAQQGDNTAAAQSLAQVKGDTALEKAAKLWTLYATRKYSP